MANTRKTEMKFKDIKKILEQNNYFLERRANSVHAKFTNINTGHSIIVSGFEGGKGRAGKVRYPIVCKVFKECGIKSW